MLVVELCGVLGRLHSNEGLAQSNNNAKLKDSAKHVTRVAGNKEKSKEQRQGGEGAPLFFFLFLFFFFFFHRGCPKTDNMNTEDLKYQIAAHTFSESTGVFR